MKHPNPKILLLALEATTKSENTHVICPIYAKVTPIQNISEITMINFIMFIHSLFSKQNKDQKNKTYPKLYKMERNPDWNVFLTIFRTTKTPQQQNILVLPVCQKKKVVH